MFYGSKFPDTAWLGKGYVSASVCVITFWDQLFQNSHAH